MEPLRRVVVIAMNAYRENVRARVLYGLMALALATCVYSLLVATLSLHQEARVVADLGSASISLYAALVAIILGATSLHREIELKTLFPILTRPLRRHEYLLGKYFGTLATLLVFVALDGAAVLALLAFEASQKPMLVGGTLVLFAAILAVTLIRAKYTRVFVVVPWAFALFAAMALLSAPAAGERQLVMASAVLTMCESVIVAAVATLFTSFSSPFLTATFTLGVFVVGRSADTLANLPAKYFGETVRSIGRVLSHVFPNLHLYVPPRPLLLGHVIDTPVWPYVGSSAIHAIFYAAVLLTVSALVFEKRDFQ
jgi:ABC-type transport system involved in multi-copper enzyme maturation permease subunit